MHLRVLICMCVRSRERGDNEYVFMMSVMCKTKVFFRNLGKTGGSLES